MKGDGGRAEICIDAVKGSFSWQARTVDERSCYLPQYEARVLCVIGQISEPREYWFVLY